MEHGFPAMPILLTSSESFLSPPCITATGPRHHRAVPRLLLGCCGGGAQRGLVDLRSLAQGAWRPAAALEREGAGEALEAQGSYRKKK